MSSSAARPNSRPPKKDSAILKKFRCTRPTIRTPDGTQWTHKTFRERPLNRFPYKPLSEAEIREKLKEPQKDVDPYARLEFFKSGDLDSPTERKPASTAIPVEQPHVVPVTKAREYLIKRLDKIHSASLKRRLSLGQLKQKDLDEMKQDYQQIQEDSGMAFAMDAFLRDNDEVYAEYPTQEEIEKVDQSQLSFIEQLRFRYNVPGYVEFEEIEMPGGASVPTVRLSHCNGEEALISLHGGCLYSWTTLNGTDRLFQNPSDIFDGRKPIKSSGISFAFPRVGKVDALPHDGFANKLLWDVVHAEVGADWLPDPAPSVTLYCRDNEETRKMWPHSFEIYYKITLSETDDFARIGPSTKEQRRFMKRLDELKSLKATKEAYLAEEAAEAELMEPPETKRSRREAAEEEMMDQDETDSETEASEPIPTQLRMQITVRNTGDKPMEFSLACRTHLRQRGLRQYGQFVRILGLRGRYYLDYNLIPGKPVLRFWDEDYLNLGEREMGWDAIFTQNDINDVFYTPGRLEYYESIARQGFPDVLLFQPGTHHPEHHHLADHVTMLGRGRVTVPAQLEPGEKWEGEYVLRHHDEYFEEPIFGYQGDLPTLDESQIEHVIEAEQVIGTDIRS